MVGDEVFADLFSSRLPSSLYRVISEGDLIPWLPPTFPWGYQHTGRPMCITNANTAVWKEVLETLYGAKTREGQQLEEFLH